MQDNTTLDPLKRKQFYPSIHAFRGIGSIFILVFHSIGLFSPGNPLIENLRPISLIFLIYFFMVSGFVNFRPLATKLLTGENPPVSAKGFLLRRFARIFPAYWFALLLWTIIPGDDRFVNGNIIPHIFLFHVFLKDGADFLFAGLFVSWSLAIEVAYLFPVMFFYFLVGRFKKSISNFLYGTIVAVFFLLILASNFYHYTVVSKNVKDGEQWLFFAQWDKFATGELLAILLGWLYLNKINIFRKIAKFKPIFWFVAFIIPLVFLTLYRVPNWTYDNVSWVKPVVVDIVILIPCLALLGFAVTSPTSLNNFFDGKLLQRLGFYSFDIFLLHPPAIKLVGFFRENGYLPKFLINTYGGPFLVFIISMALAWFSYSVVTRPALHLINRFGSSSSRPTLENNTSDNLR